MAGPAGPSQLLPAAKRRKNNKFKQKQNEAAGSPAKLPHGTVSGAALKQKKRKKKHQQPAGDVDETVAVQADAPGAAQRQQAAAAAPRSGGSGGGGPAFAPPSRIPSGSPAAGGKKGKGSGSVLQQMRARLQGGRFRWLNEELYTSDGARALAMVEGDPDLMQQYHEGFREQTKGWPVQPVDQAIAWLRRRPEAWEVADLGCGDAKIAATLAPRQQVHSFDLASTAPGVVACNMADVPLGDASVDAAIFCLSLMGTDYGSFLEEAARILRPSGWLWIAEVQSRFVGADDGRSVLPAFEGALRALGFEVRRKDTSNSHFLVLEAQRQGAGGGAAAAGGKQRQRQAVAWPELRPCQYKKR